MDKIQKDIFLFFHWTVDFELLLCLIADYDKIRSSWNGVSKFWIILRLNSKTENYVHPSSLVTWASAMPDSASEGSVGKMRIGRSHTVCSVFSWNGPLFLVLLIFVQLFSKTPNLPQNAFILILQILAFEWLCTRRKLKMQSPLQMKELGEETGTDKQRNRQDKMGAFREEARFDLACIAENI